jgi:hypothetical protein
MIERQTIGGREATIAYTDSQFNPTDKTTATQVKVIFDDGEVIFLVVPPSPTTPTKSRRSPVQETLHRFAHAIGVAEKHRKTLKRRFGFTDQQIGALIRRKQP